MFWGTVIVLFLLGATGFIAYAIYGSAMDTIRNVRDRSRWKAEEASEPLHAEKIWLDPDLSEEERDEEIAMELEEQGVVSDTELSAMDRYDVLRIIEEVTMRRDGFPCPRCRKPVGVPLDECPECGKRFKEKPYRVTRQKDGKLKVEFVG